MPALLAVSGAVPALLVWGTAHTVRGIRAVGQNPAAFEDRVQMDAWYVHDWSVWLDPVILARTAQTVFFGKGAY